MTPQPRTNRPGQRCRLCAGRWADPGWARLLLILAFALVLVAGPAADSQAGLVENPVEPARLAALFEQTDKIVVTDLPMAPEEGATVLFSSADPKDIAELREAVTVVASSEIFRCLCIGTPTVHLYQGNTELANFSNQHGTAIRCSLWTSDAGLRDPEKWLQWFDARQMPWPRKEVRLLIAQRAEAEQAAAASRRRLVWASVAAVLLGGIVVSWRAWIVRRLERNSLP